MDRKYRQLLKRSRFLVTLVKSMRFGMEYYRTERRKDAWRLSRWKPIESYFKTFQIRKLQIGAGNNFLEGWLNTDTFPLESRIAYLDATEPLPFDDAVFDFIFSEHMIEHITYNEGKSWLRECYRVLKPNGKIRIATPWVDRLIGLYASEKTDLQNRFIKYITDGFLAKGDPYEGALVVDLYFRGFTHKFLYDYQTLHRALQEAGFTQITQFSPGQSDDENLRGIECGSVVHGDDINQFVTMVLESKRPD